jgi:membrane-bound lytic murein transglycosylase MltF
MKKIKYIIFLFTLLFNTFLSADEKMADHLSQIRKTGIKRILNERYFRVLTTKNSFDYYIYQGVPKGIQLEMTKMLHKNINKRYASKESSLNIQYEIIPVESDQLIPMLLAGKGDIIAAGLTITPKRKKLIRFSNPYRHVDEVIVTRKEFLKKDFYGKTFHLRKSTSYYEAIKKYNRKHKKKPFKIKLVDEVIHTENILELISLGKFDYTIADSYIASMATKIFDNLVILKARPFGKKLPIAWAVRKNNKRLTREINLIMPKMSKGSKIGNIISKKYLSDFGGIKSRLKGKKSNTLSKYDSLIKKYSKRYGFDWRLISALCYQESRFIQNQENKWGAIGLFQIKQMTANEPYVNIPKIKGPKNAENNIHAGVKYLAWIRDRYFAKIPGIDKSAVLRLTMAAYNAGPARVLRAIKATKKIKLSSKKWFRNVEYGMLRMKKVEPVTYVSEINKRYVSYLLLGIPE